MFFKRIREKLQEVHAIDMLLEMAIGEMISNGTYDTFKDRVKCTQPKFETEVIRKNVEAVYKVMDSLEVKIAKKTIAQIIKPEN